LEYFHLGYAFLGVGGPSARPVVERRLLFGFVGGTSTILPLMGIASICRFRTLAVFAYPRRTDAGEKPLRPFLAATWYAM